MPLLAAFDLPQHVSASTAKQDKIEFSLPLGFIEDRRENREYRRKDSFVSFMLEHLAGPAMEVENPVSLVEPPRRMHSRVFVRPPKSLKFLTVRSRDNRIGNVPLFAGRLITSAGRANECIQLKLQATANLTRYVRHQDANRAKIGASEITDNAALIESLFLHNEGATGRDGEFSLDGSDNWIPDRAVWSSFCKPWEMRQREYFHALKALSADEIERVKLVGASAGRPSAILPPKEGDAPSLQKVETYWEFKEEHPLELVAALEPLLQAYCGGNFSRRTFAAHYADGNFSFERESNSRIIRGKVSGGIEIAIYAKTNKRVRFEVRHHLDLASWERALSQTFHSVDDAVERLATVSSDAASVLNKFFDFLAEQTTPEIAAETSSPSPLDFVFYCCRAAKSPRYAEAIVSMLMANDCIVRLSPLVNAIRAMKRKGLIEPVNNEQGQQSSIFRVTPPYRRALELLREIDRAESISTRQRTRRL